MTMPSLDIARVGVSPQGRLLLMLPQAPGGVRSVFIALDVFRQCNHARLIQAMPKAHDLEPDETFVFRSGGRHDGTDRRDVKAFNTRLPGGDRIVLIAFATAGFPHGENLRVIAPAEAA